MTIALMTLLLLLCAVVLAYPFLVRTGADEEADPAEDMTEQLRRARDRVYEEVRALQQEYFLENLTEEEYQAQLLAARRKAAALIRQQQQLQAALQDAEARAEEEIRLAAAGAGRSADRSAEA